MLSRSFQRWPHLAQPPTGTGGVRELSGPVTPASDLPAPPGLSSHSACFPQSPGASVSAQDHLYPELLADAMMAGPGRAVPTPSWTTSVPCCLGEGTEKVSCRVGLTLSRHTQGQVMKPLK